MQAYHYSCTRATSTVQVHDEIVVVYHCDTGDEVESADV